MERREKTLFIRYTCTIYNYISPVIHYTFMKPNGYSLRLNGCIFHESCNDKFD